MKTAISPVVRHSHFRGNSFRLASLPEFGSDVKEQAEYENVVSDALECIALALYEENKDLPQETSIVAIESVCNLDDALSWLDCMTSPSLTEACNPKEQLQAFLLNVVRLRHLVFQEDIRCRQALSTLTVKNSELSPTDVFKYVYRFNRLHRCHGGSSLSNRLSNLESTLRLYVSGDVDPELEPLHHLRATLC